MFYWRIKYILHHFMPRWGTITTGCSDWRHSPVSLLCVKNCLGRDEIFILDSQAIVCSDRIYYLPHPSAHPSGTHLHFRPAHFLHRRVHDWISIWSEFYHWPIKFWYKLLQNGKMLIQNLLLRPWRKVHLFLKLFQKFENFPHPITAVYGNSASPRFPRFHWGVWITRPLKEILSYFLWKPSSIYAIFKYCAKPEKYVYIHEILSIIHNLFSVNDDQITFDNLQLKKSVNLYINL